MEEKREKSRKKLERDEKGRLLPGRESLNPLGKPLGTKSFTTDFDEVVEELAKENKMTKSEVRKILLKKAFAEAKNGNFNFYKDTLDRYYGKPVERIETEQTIKITELEIDA